MLQLLLRAGADPNRGSKIGGVALHSGVAFRNHACVRSLIKHAKGLRIDAGLTFNDASPLNLAAYLSSPEIVETLIDAGADVGHVQAMGGCPLTDAACNPATTIKMMEQISAGLVDLNYVQKPRTAKWGLIYRLFEMLYKSSRVSKSDLIMYLAHDLGSTALHHAARRGHVELISWMLRHGAHQSLDVRNKLGSTPLDQTRIFGPFPEAEALLGSAMMDKHFHTRFVIEKGSKESFKARGMSAVIEETGLEVTEATVDALEQRAGAELAPLVEPVPAMDHVPAVGFDRAASRRPSAIGELQHDGLGGHAARASDILHLQTMLEALTQAQRNDSAAIHAELRSLRADLNLSA